MTTYPTERLTVIDSLLIGDSEGMCRLRQRIVQISPTTLPVLIAGPTGAGKELVAQSLHIMSGRSGRFVAFNVCALAETMFEDALFGHVRGAFTGAASDSAGYLAEADLGTIFFDEIGALSLTMQAKLLRAIETREFRPVGAHSDRRSDFRVVAATNESIDQLASERHFRLDLVHRLCGTVLTVPALCERLEDIPKLASSFARACNTGASAEPLTSGALRALQQHDWPGNVRELRNVVELAMALAAGEPITEPLIAELLPRARGVPRTVDRRGFQRRQLLDLLQRCGWNTACVADHLKVNRATVYRRMDQFNIPTPDRLMTRRA